MSAARSLVHQLEASIRYVRQIQARPDLQVLAKAVHDAIDNRSRYRHTSSPTADALLLRAYAAYFEGAEKARGQQENV